MGLQRGVQVWVEVEVTREVEEGEGVHVRHQLSPLSQNAVRTLLSAMKLALLLALELAVTLTLAYRNHSPPYLSP